LQLIIGNYGLSLDQAKAQMAMWCMLAAPLIMSADLRAIRPEFKEILLNREAIKIDQDPLGVQVSQSSCQTISLPCNQAGKLVNRLCKIFKVLYVCMSAAMAFEASHMDVSLVLSYMFKAFVEEMCYFILYLNPPPPPPTEQTLALESVNLSERKQELRTGKC
jgi:hypothetical protein